MTTRTRFLAIQLILGMIVALLTGCGGSSGSSSEPRPNTTSSSTPSSSSSTSTGTVEFVIENNGTRSLTRSFPVNTTQVEITVQQNGTTVGQPVIVNLPPVGSSTTVTVSDIPLGPSTVIVTALDANGKSLGTANSNFTVTSSSVPLMVPIVFPTPLSISPTTANAAPGGTVTFTAAGGNPPYAFSMTTNNSQDAFINPDAGGTTATYTAGSRSGTQDTVQVEDSTGNKVQATVLVGFVIISPQNATVAIGHTLTFTASGGSGSGYVFTLKTNNSGGSITPQGVYTPGTKVGAVDTVLVTDSEGNTGITNVTVQPLGLQTSMATIAFQGTFQLVPMGGAPPYTYTDTATTPVGSVSSSGLFTAGTTPGTDTIKVTDSQGNTTTATLTVSGVQILANGVPVTGSTTADGPAAVINFTATFVQAPVTWSLTQNQSGGQINANTGVYTAGPTGSTTDIVKVVDSQNNTATVQITVGATEQLTIFGSNSVSGPAATDNLSVFNGLAPYTWSISVNHSGPAASLSSNTGTSITYTAGQTPSVADTIQVKDSLNNVATFQINVGGALSVLNSPFAVTPDGTLNFSPTGGTGNYSYSLVLTNSGTPSVSSSGPTCTYTAGNNPNTTDVVEINDGNTMVYVVIYVQTGVLINGPANAITGTNVTLTASGGTNNFTSWAITTNNSGGSISFSGNTATYTAGSTTNTSDTITVTDSGHNTATLTIKVLAPITFTVGGNATTVYNGNSGSTINFDVSGGTGTYNAPTVVVNGSGGAAPTGAGGAYSYTPGGTDNTTDIIQITDSAGFSAILVIKVGPPT